MTEYIDIHSHILPGLDDGPKDDAQTLSMLKTAYEQGVRVICATPHFRPAMFKVSISERQKAYERVRDMAKRIAPDFEIILGNELYFTEDSIGYLRDGVCKCIGSTRYVLVEFSTRAEFSVIRRSVNRLVLEGYIPIIAHIERYVCVIGNIDRVEELVDIGGYIQINSSSFFSKRLRIRNFVRKLLKHNLIHFIGSDSHNDSDRGYRFTETAGYIEKKYGSKYVQKLMYKNPVRMLNDEFI